MDEELLDEENWKIEAEAVANDIKNHVKSVEIADGNDQLVYINLTTIEGSTYCIELSSYGFRIVGNKYNEKTKESELYFETPYSLLNSISPQFKESFGNELIDKLNNLK